MSREVLTAATDRWAYFSCAHGCSNLFLDPDKGIRLESPHPRGKRAQEYLYADELVQLIAQRPQALTVVFDQSLARGQEQESLEVKLCYLASQHVSAFAYRSHACFVIAGVDGSLVERARAHIVAESRLPKSRFHSLLQASAAARAES